MRAHRRAARSWDTRSSTCSRTSSTTATRARSSYSAAQRSAGAAARGVQGAGRRRQKVCTGCLIVTYRVCSSACHRVRDRVGKLALKCGWVISHGNLAFHLWANANNAASLFTVDSKTARREKTPRCGKSLASRHRAGAYGRSPYQARARRARPMWSFGPQARGPAATHGPPAHSPAARSGSVTHSPAVHSPPGSSLALRPAARHPAARAAPGSPAVPEPPPAVHGPPGVPAARPTQSWLRRPPAAWGRRR